MIRGKGMKTVSEADAMTRARRLCMWFFTPLLVVLVGACAVSPPETESDGKPEWVIDLPEDGRHAWGVGSAPIHGDAGQARQTASDRARNDLLSQLRVEIEGETRTWVQRLRDSDGSEVTRGYSDQIRARVPEVSFDEMDIAEVAVDEAENVLYALARLDLPMAEMRLATELRRVRDKLDELSRVDADKQGMEAVRALKPAVELIAEGEEIERHLSMVSRGGPEREPVADAYSEVLDRLAEAMAGLRIALRPAGDTAESLASALRTGLVEQGMRIVDEGELDLLVEFDFDIREVERAPDFFAYAEGRVRIRDGEDRTTAEFSERVREGATDPGLARDRVTRALAGQLGRTLGEEIWSSL